MTPSDSTRLFPWDASGGSILSKMNGTGASSGRKYLGGVAASGDGGSAPARCLP